MRGAGLRDRDGQTGVVVIRVLGAWFSPCYLRDSYY